MKHFLFFAVSLLSLVATAQTTFSVAQATPALAVTANATIDITTTAGNVVTRTMDMQNISTTTNVYNVKMYDLILHPTAIDTAQAYFCFGGCCFGVGTKIGMCTLTLTPGQNTATMGDFYSLNCDLQEASTVGYSVVKYTIYNINQASDSMQFTLRYNYLLQGTGLKNLQQSALLSLQPNPAKDLVSLQINNHNASEATIQLLDIGGKIVLNQTNTLQAGENNIALDLQGISPGFYYLRLHNQNAVISRKLVIE